MTTTHQNKIELNSQWKKTILLTGGCGFIGSNLCRYLVNKYTNYLIINFDALTYAGNLNNLLDIKDKENYHFYKGNITDKTALENVFETFGVTDVLHLAAESHVDRSMTNPNIFIETNIIGSVTLFDVAKKFWDKNIEKHTFLNMATDEIFGSLNLNDEPFNETTPLNPHSPYSTSKTAQAMFAKTYYEAYNLPIINLACGNAIGPYQFPEKLVPLVIHKLINNEKIPVYGNGLNMRDWTNVYDICTAIDLLLHKGKHGELYCIGGDACVSNIEIINNLINEYSKQTGANINKLNDLITYIKDPRGKSHDFRYDINHNKITKELNWIPKYTFQMSIQETLMWYLNNQKWMNDCITGDYLKWIFEYYK